LIGEIDMKVRISDHALVRWLERVHDIDMNDFRTKLAAIAQPFHDAKLKHAEVGGLWFVFDGGVLVTVTPTKPSISQLHRHDRDDRNGTGKFGDTPHWKAAKRKRHHR
jgi:hypothetical protein